MSNELSIFEAMGGTYRTVDGILYPNISECSDNTLSVTITDVGKYGLIWISYTIMNKYLTSHKPKDSNSTMEMWKLREQAKQLAEEVIYGEIVYQYH